MEAWGLPSLPAPPCARQPGPRPPLKCVPQSSATTLGRAGLSTDRSRGGPGPMLTVFRGVRSDLNFSQLFRYIKPYASGIKAFVMWLPMFH